METLRAKITKKKSTYKFFVLGNVIWWLKQQVKLHIIENTNTFNTHSVCGGLTVSFWFQDIKTVWTSSTPHPKRPPPLAHSTARPHRPDRRVSLKVTVTSEQSTPTLASQSLTGTRLFSILTPLWRRRTRAECQLKTSSSMRTPELQYWKEFRSNQPKPAAFELLGKIN